MGFNIIKKTDTTNEQYVPGLFQDFSPETYLERRR